VIFKYFYAVHQFNPVFFYTDDIFITLECLSTKLILERLEYMQVRWHQIYRSISVNADGPHDAALHKIDNIALHTEYNYHLVDLLLIYYTTKFATNTVTN